MLQFLLILLGLISNPNSNNSSNSNHNGEPTTVTQSDAADTGGDDGQTPPRK